MEKDKGNHYSYDGLNQLSEESGEFQRKFSFDSLHNPLKNGEQEFSSNGLNQLVSKDPNLELEYDEQGCLSRKKAGIHEQNYEYDPLGRLISVQEERKRVCFIYDSFDRCISREEQSCNWDSYDEEIEWQTDHIKDFIYEDRNEIGALSRSKELLEFRVLGKGITAETGASISIELGGQVFAVMHDHRGNVTQLIDPKTRVVKESYHYSAFGDRKVLGEGYWQPSKKSILGNPWQFASKRTEEDFELVNYGRRFYLPDLCRWLTPDPMGLQAGINLYAFVSNNPVNRFDSYGLFDFSGFCSDICSSIGSCFRSVCEWGSNLFSGFMDGFSNVFGEGISFAGKHLVPAPKEIREKIVNFGRRLSGNDEVFKQESPSVGSVGVKKEGQNLIISHTGILNFLKDSKETAQGISDDCGGVEVFYIHSPSHGFIVDLLKAAYEFFGGETNSIKSAKKVLKDSCFAAKHPKLGYSGKVKYISHSRGTIEASSVIDHLYSEGIRNFEAIGIGGARILSKKGIKCSNYINVMDPIPLLSIFNIGLEFLKNGGKSINFIAQRGIPFLEHSSNSYLKNLSEEILL